MYGLARRKIALAEQIGSRALHADAVESITCGWLSLSVVIGLLAQLALGFWWIDSVTSLAIVGLLIKEAREAWAGEEGSVTPRAVCGGVRVVNCSDHAICMMPIAMRA
jgi:hypothetical protein